MLSPDLQILYKTFLRFDMKSPGRGGNSDLKRLADALVEGAIIADLDKSRAVLQQPYYGSMRRNFKAPIAFVLGSILGRVWADSPDAPLEPGEQWNSGRRQCHNEVCYQIDGHGYPINPYMNTGIRERGRVGRYGPNHAVDIAPLRIMPDQEGCPKLHLLGIVRQDNRRPALCGGFIDFERSEKSCDYKMDDQQITLTQTREMIEEMISGAVTLDPGYKIKAESAFERKISHLELTQAEMISTERYNTLKRQLETTFRLRQIEDKDPEFIRRLYHEISQSYPCYAGPVLSSGRNTNNAWMETYLSWFELTDEKWRAICGQNPGFDYDFSPGDDARAVRWHKIDPAFIRQGAASHGAYAVYLLSDYVSTVPLTPAQKTGLKEQMEEIEAWLLRQREPSRPGLALPYDLD